MSVLGIDSVVRKKRIQRSSGVRVTVRVVAASELPQAVSRPAPGPTAYRTPKIHHTIFKGLSAYALILIVMLSFASGLWVMWQTHSSLAENSSEAVQTQQTPPGTIPILIEHTSVPQASPASDAALYNMSLEQLEYYLQEGYKTPEMRQTELLRIRAEKIRAYLASKKSPLADIADTLAGLRHWRVVIAISNAESSLGKRCADNNCSGIGVEPGHPLWREYETKADWARDLDALIEKRYKNWTLEIGRAHV